MGGSFLPSGQTLIVIPRGLQGLGPKGGIGVLGLHTYRYTTQCLAPQILDLHYNATPPWSLSLPVHQCTGAPTDLLLLSTTCSKSQGHAIQSRLSWGLVGWVRVLGELWMLCWVGGILGFLIPHPLRKDTPIFFFSFTSDQLVKFCHLLLESFFLTFFF